VRVHCFVPAHNEEAVIGECLDALMRQSMPVERLFVIADRCTDGTSRVARERGAEVVPVCGGTKARALNAVLVPYLDPERYRALDDGDAVLVVDADSFLDPWFVESAARYLKAGGYGAVGGVFRGRGSGYLAFAQQQEFLRYARDTARLQGKALTLTGTAMMFSVGAARAVVRSRRGERQGELYSTANLVEDLELSLRFLRLGYAVLAPKDLTLSTECMGTWRELARQRLRWREGAVRCVREYGWGTGTRELSLRLAWGAVGIVALFGYLSTLAYGLLFSGGFAPALLWAAVTAVFSVEQAVTVYRRGGLVRAVAGGSLVFELPYQVFLQAVHALAYLRALVPGERSW